MSDEGFDLCECIWGHEMAMRRLLSRLRQSQAYCTDELCLEEMPGTGLPNAEEASNNLLLMTICWIVLALVLYFLRPNNARGRNDSKPQNNGFGPHGTPPAPPPAAN